MIETKTINFCLASSALPPATHSHSAPQKWLALLGAILVSSALSSRDCLLRGSCLALLPRDETELDSGRPHTSSPFCLLKVCLVTDLTCASHSVYTGRSCDAPAREQTIQEAPESDSQKATQLADGPTEQTWEAHGHDRGTEAPVA